MKRFISTFFACENGATAIEYGLIAALIAVALIVVLGAVSTNLQGTFSKTAASLG